MQPSPPPSEHPAGLEERLAALERASDERRAELRELAGRLPAAMSRRTLLAAAVADLRRAPDRGEIVRRVLRKLRRAPGALVRRVRARSGPPRRAS